MSPTKVDLSVRIKCSIENRWSMSSARISSQNQMTLSRKHRYAKPPPWRRLSNHGEITRTRKHEDSGGWSVASGEWLGTHHTPTLRRDNEHAETPWLHLSHKRLRRILSGDRFNIRGGQVDFLGDWIIGHGAGPELGFHCVHEFIEVG
jgi:hypothetical protein